ANEDQRIIAADYYPTVVGSIPGEYVPVTGIHRQESTSKTQDFIGSEIREKAVYTWRVIDNGQVGGAVLRARAARETNELTCKKLEANVSRELSRIANDLRGIEARESSLSAASVAAEEGARIKNDFMGRRSGGRAPCRAGVLFPDAGGGSGYSPPGHCHLRRLWDGADRAGVRCPHSSAK